MWRSAEGTVPGVVSYAREVGVERLRIESRPNGHVRESAYSRHAEAEVSQARCAYVFGKTSQTRLPPTQQRSRRRS